MKSDIRKVLVIGSGPIIIGQAAEFDYAGVQACRALREEGVKSVLLNSNPATIMTDQDVADHIYIEPLKAETVELILERERPQGILGTLGGQTGLNLLMELSEKNVFSKYGVEVLGTSVDSIAIAEDRNGFSQFLNSIDEPAPPSEAVNNVEDALRAARQIGFPVIVRPAYTLGGTGGGFAHNEEELIKIVSGGIELSRVGQVLIEKSLLNWKEVEYEVVRDGSGNAITVCNMENIDPLGVHTGDSMVVAPSQTLTDKEYHQLRSASLKIVNELNIRGGCNVQLAARPYSVRNDSDYYVIEVNPRVSRSSALASKATGYPIARVATKIALGYSLDQIKNTVTGKTTAASEPALDYCVVKMPRLPFDKFQTADRTLGTQMKATGEVMAIDRTFEAALQKAVRGLENGIDHLGWESPQWQDLERIDLLPDDLRLWKVAANIRRGVSVESITRESGIGLWFVKAIERIIAMERTVRDNDVTPDLMYEAKRMGFSDAYIATLRGSLPEKVRQTRLDWGIRAVYKMVDTCAGEFEASTPYFYSTYEQENETEALPSTGAIVLGSGPIRIGQGIEFDYCSVHAAKSLHNFGVPSIMVNSNPETVSTDFDISSRLYFESLTEESIRDIIDNETALLGGDSPSLVVQFGGQTAINISQSPHFGRAQIMGSDAEVIDNTSDRGKFEAIASQHGIALPPGGIATNLKQALNIASSIGYPILVRPSYVLGGRAMEIIQNEDELARYFKNIRGQIDAKQVLLVDKYLSGIELEVDAVSDGKDVLIPGIMQHVERAGVHSGDSVVVYPEQTLTKKQVDLVVKYTEILGRAFGIRGLMNIQYVLPHGQSPDQPAVYAIEVNPRASRTVPFISKVTNVPLIKIAIGVLLGQTLRKQGLTPGLQPKRKFVAIKSPVFSTWKLSGADTFLGPEMKSTGEAMGIDYNLDSAMYKALYSAGLSIPPKDGTFLLSIADKDKPEAEQLIKQLHANNYKLYATHGTAEMVRRLNIPVEVVEKRLSDSPNIITLLMEGLVDAVLNTVTGNRQTLQDGFHIRRTATERQIPCFTSLDTASAAIQVTSSYKSQFKVKRLEEYLKSEG